jgi:putative ABC transport system permease protein
MFGYYLDLALRSLKRNPILTALMVLAIGLGIGASMTMITVLHVMSGDPLPGRSGELYYPHIDPLPLNYQQRAYAPDPSVNFTWPDAMALLAAPHVERQAVMTGGQVLVRPTSSGVHPFDIDGRFTTAGFFGLFGRSFLHGRGWTAADDDARARVVVLSESLSVKLFGTADSVNRMVHFNDSELRVIGVIPDWNPQPLFYGDSSSTAFGKGDGFYLPLATSLDLKFHPNANQSSWLSFDGDMKSPVLTWLQVWVQLKDSAQVAAYRQFLYDYSARQKALGRFERPPTQARLYDLMSWLNHRGLVPSDIRLQLWLALGFLLVCMTNIVALLLAKFLRRSGEVSVRRALGAKRRDIFLQLGMESAVIGLAGGMLGLAVAQLGLWSVRRRPDDYAQLATMDTSMLVGTFALAVAASVLAGLLPAWRACRVAPAMQLKTL